MNIWSKQNDRWRNYYTPVADSWRAGQGNAYVEINAPWKLKTEDVRRMQTVIFVLMECIRVIGILLQPFIPDGAMRILRTIYSSSDPIPFSEIRDVNISGFSINQIDQLFKKFDIWNLRSENSSMGLFCNPHHIIVKSLWKYIPKVLQFGFRALKLEVLSII